MKLIHIVILVALILLCGGGAWFFVSSFSTTSNVLPGGLFGGSPATSTEITTTQGRVVGVGQKEYRNNTYKFSLLYPESLSVKEIDEGEGAMTVTFENIKTLEGFQIFIVPFAGQQITDDRFKKDVPSGVRKNLQDITIDGATGASFYSTHSTLGETAEVWFIKNNYLYEVNTFKKLDTWLSGIMATWKFLP